MSTYIPALESPELLEWSSISGRGPWPTLLLGNGASRTVWAKYSYESLYGAAVEAGDVAGLSTEAAAVFAELGTTNFEYVLGALETSRRVQSALGGCVRPTRNAYHNVQTALGNAVQHVHVPWDSLPTKTLATIKSELRAYEYVFSTNYDLIAYWAIMHEDDTEPFKDFFWGPSYSFDVTDCTVKPNSVSVYYLHGGLHLRRSMSTGLTFKSTSAQGDLLRQFARIEPEAHPLIVTEGTAEDKLRSIRTSDYLGFCHRSLESAPDGVVAIGHSLSTSDDHLVETMVERAQAGKRRIALTLRGTGDVTARKVKFASRLPGCDLWFVQSASHPLLDPRLEVRT